MLAATSSARLTLGDPTVEGQAVDPITFSVIMKRLESIADEMTLAIEHSAWSTLLSLNRDLSGAVYDRNARQASTAEALPIQVTTLGFAMAEIMAEFGDDLRPGDVYLCNDPYRGNVHAGDLVTAEPVFADGIHAFWAVTRAHHIDIGAFIPSSVAANARDIYQEGLTIPPVRLAREGVLDHGLMSLILANVRYRDVFEGDLLAQLGALHRGADRLAELCHEFGVPEVIRYVEEIQAHADRIMAAQIRDIPDGTYRGVSWVDTDGVATHDIEVSAVVTVDGDEVTVDFSGCGPQGAGGMNASRASSFGAQVHELVVDIDRADTVDMPALAAAFDSDHSRMFGYSRPELELELLHCRVRARGVAGVTGPLASNPAESFPGPVASRTRDVYLPERGERIAVGVYDASALEPGVELPGPLIVTSPTTTILVPDGCTLSAPHAEAFLIEVGLPD